MALQVKTSINGNLQLANAYVVIEKVDFVAPAAMTLRVEGITEDMHLTAGFYWWNDSGEGDWEQLSDGHPFKVGGKEMGLTPDTTWVFEIPQEVNYAVRITYKGDEVVLRGSFTILDPDTVYPDEDTFYYSLAGTFPGGATNTYTSASSLHSAMRAHNGDKRILFRRGENYGADMAAAAFRIRQDTDFTGEVLYFDAYDTGAKPIIDQATSDGRYVNVVGAEFLKFCNFDLQGAYDPVTETGTSVRGIYAPQDAEKTSRIMFHSCTASGMEIAFYPGGGQFDAGYWITDTRVDGWQNYGAFGGANYVGIAGTYICQDPDAMGGGDKDNHDQTGNDHGSFRSSSIYISIGAVEMFCNNAWSQAGGKPSHSPTIRLFTSSGTAGARGSVYGAVVEGSNVVWPASVGAAGSPPMTHKLIRLDSNIMVGTANSYLLIELGYGGLAGYNNILINPNSPQEAAGWRHWLDFRDGNELANGEDPTNKDHPIHWRNNAEIHLHSSFELSATFLAIEDEIYDKVSGPDPEYAGSTYGNNWRYAPNSATDPINASDDVDLTPIMAAKYKGYLSKTDFYDFTLASDVAPGQSVTISYKSGITSADLVQSFDDTRDYGDVPSAGQSSTLTYNANDFTLTNTSSLTWPSGNEMFVSLRRVQGKEIPLDTTYASPAGTIALYSPGASFSGLGAATGDTAELDFFGNIRSAVTSTGPFDGVVG